MQLAGAEHDSTAHHITGMLSILARCPEFVPRPREGSAFISQFIEESLRYFFPGQGRYRRTGRDAEFADKHVCVGDRLQRLFGSGSDDESVFSEPERFDMEQANLSRPSAFGSGIHTGDGAPLARVESRVTLEVLLSRPGDTRFEESVEPFNWDRHFHLRGYRSLPLTFTLIERA